MQPIVRVHGFSKSYGTTPAVQDLSFEVFPGQILGLVGANGAGKTSTLNSLVGAIAPTQGLIEIAGHNIVDAPIEAKRCAGFVPDVPHLFDTLTVWEHIQFTAAAYNVRDYVQHAEQLLDWLNLTQKRHAMAITLSRGMRQKVAIACAFLPMPPVYIFDEPLTGLDPRGIRLITDSFEEKSKAGAAVIVSSHLLHLVENVCSHLLVLHAGRRCAFGRMDQVLSEFETSDRGTTLEQVFFSITEETARPPAAL